MTFDYHLWEQEKDCCGCSACYGICPRNAISLEENREGFLYPRINKTLCISCGKCTQVCAYKQDLLHYTADRNPFPARIFAARHKNQEVVRTSSSGGLFTAISDYYLTQGNAVASCIYNCKSRRVEFQLYDSEKMRNKAKGSKYIQAYMGDIFSECFSWLAGHDGKKIVFFGTGCQVAGFLKYAALKQIRSRVLAVDLICHGAPSPRLWKEYVAHLERKENHTAGELSFKDKRNGWMDPFSYIRFGEKEISVKPYADWFYREWSIRESCYQCPYTKMKRNSDLTIGDFWGIQQSMPHFFDPMGVSLLLLQSEEGQAVFKEIEQQLIIEESNEKACLQPRLIFPANRPADRDRFWSDYEKKGIAYCQKHYTEAQKSCLSGFCHKIAAFLNRLCPNTR